MNRRRFFRAMVFSTGFALVALNHSAARAADLLPLQRTPPERLQTGHLKNATEAAAQFARERRSVLNQGIYQDYRAVIHVHAEDAPHTRGTRAEVLAAAKKAGVQAVLFTDHRGPLPETWRGLRDGVLFLAGSEDGNGTLRFPDFGADGKVTGTGLKFLSHIEERYEAAIDGFDGMEICNRHTDLILDKGVEDFLTRAAEDPAQWKLVTENFRAYPDAMFAAGCDYRTNIFAKWDRAIEQRPFTGIGANDAHQNVILKGVTFDPYEVSFRNLCTHLLARDLTEEEIRSALRAGHGYVSHDWLCDPSGFSFVAVNNLGVFPMGDTALLQGRTRIVGLTPIPANLRLIHDGRVVAQTNGTNLTFVAKATGAYRLEAWLVVDGEERPWIYSNPVYVRQPTLLSLPIPNITDTPEVRVKRNITYTSGEPGDDPKHQLDLYLPAKENRSAPILVFLHGGAWRSGDRALYPPLGKCLARSGILTVIPSYRLAPAHPYPAQIEDAAAAVAWAAAHLAEEGGDTNRIFLAGHSAGGHLASLLALDDRYLSKHGWPRNLIKGVITISGVYTFDEVEGLTSVFGKDAAFRHDASPLSHVRAPAPPFLIGYCEWDYPTLPFQAKRFDAALKRAGISSQVQYIAKESHISEIIAMTHDENATTRRLVEFVKQSGVAR